MYKFVYIVYADENSCGGCQPFSKVVHILHCGENMSMEHVHAVVYRATCGKIANQITALEIVY